MTPEARAREQIDAMLKDCGWEVQDYKQFIPSAARVFALLRRTGAFKTLILVKNDRHADGDLLILKEVTKPNRKNDKLPLAVNDGRRWYG